MDISGRVAIVTGAGSGAGQVVAERLAGAGAAVMVVDVDADLAEEASSRLNALGGPGSGTACAADVLSADDREALVRRAHQLGGPHVLVNNAGGWGSAGRQYPRATPAEWREVLELNLAVPMDLTQRCLPLMSRLGGGVIVNIASSAGREDTPYRSPEYAAAKAALIRFSTAVADIAGEHGVRVNCVVPNWIGLPRALDELAAMTATQREASPTLIPPAEVAEVVADLIADDSLNGRVMVLEGGRAPVLLDVRQ